MTINYYIDSKQSRIGESCIYCYVRGVYKQKTIYINTHIKLNPEQWNEMKQEVRRNHPDFSTINNYLAKMRAEINTFYVEFVRNNKIDFEVFKEQLLAKLFQGKVSNKEISVIEAFKKYLEFTKIDKSSGTLRIYNGLYNQIKEYQDYIRQEISFEDINIEFFERFLDFSISIKKNSNNTAYKKNKQLKTFFKWAEDRGFLKRDDYKKVKIREDQVDNIHLSDKELKDLFDLDLSNNLRLDRVRDVFCMECFTGQRFSDIANLDFNDIKDNFWLLRTKKTRDILRIPLNEYALSILRKYKESGALPVISNQRTNNYLKELAKLAEINEPTKRVYYRGSKRIEETKPKYEFITSHVGRRTFVTLSLEKGMRPEVVMAITGHKDLKTFSKYIKITTDITQQEMMRAWNDGK